MLVGSFANFAVVSFKLEAHILPRLPANPLTISFAENIVLHFLLKTPVYVP